MAAKGSLLRRLAYIPAYWRFNLAMNLEYKVSFISQVLAMAVNDALWVVFWGLYFTKFPQVAGWRLADVLTVWSVVAVSFGLMLVLGGNVGRLPALIAEGQLDFYLALPKPVLPHLLVSRMFVMAWGDVLFGVFVFLAFVAGSWLDVAAFVLAALPAAVIMISYMTIAGSLAFFAGHGEQSSRIAMEAMVTFSVYPQAIFDRPVRLLLYTLVPAALVSGVPVTFIRTQSWPHLALLWGAAAGFAGLAWAVFYTGLRRYESGNLMGMRS